MPESETPLITIIRVIDLIQEKIDSLEREKSSSSGKYDKIPYFNTADDAKELVENKKEPNEFVTRYDRMIREWQIRKEFFESILYGHKVKMIVEERTGQWTNKKQQVQENQEK